MSRRNKILNKVMLKRSKSKRTTTTTETTTVASSTQTPATAVMGQDTPYTGTGLQRHQEHQWITDRAVEIAIEDPDFYMQPGMGLVGDGETQSVLDEREFIRQQLFYEEQGVEVAAQFSPSPNGTSRTTLYPASIQNPPRQQQKEILTTSVERSVAVSPDNHYSFEKPAQTPLPPTPQLEPSEVDPLKHFPAVAAAVAKAEASRRHRAPVVVRTVSENSNSVSETSAISGQQQQHQRPGMATQTPSASLLPKTVVTPPTPSPEKPFDEVDGPEDPTIAEMEQMERQRKAAHRRPFSLGATKESKESAVSSEKAQKEESVPPETRGQAEEEKEDKDITRKLLDAFNCGGDDFTEFSGSTAQNTSRSCRLVDAFYDNTCWTYREAAAVKRPYYDERFAQRFLKVRRIQ